MWALQRAKFLLLHEAGALERRTPLRQWEDQRISDLLRPDIPTLPEEYLEWRKQTSIPFPPEAKSNSSAQSAIGDGSIRSSEAILKGEFPFFGYTELLGFPPEWTTNPITSETGPKKHWSKLSEFAFGDVKFLWEPSRFGWAFPLARAYRKSEDERYAEAFWTLLESWMRENPPFCGINWKCGQEASVRVIALSFAFSMFRDATSSSPTRIQRLIMLLASLGQRIESYIEYGISQKNNHGISEAVGLWSIGHLFPELRAAARWRLQGKRTIEFEVRRQVYADGSYIQHSINYHRVFLHLLAWSLRIGQCCHDEFDLDIYDALRQSATFLHKLTDPFTGWAANHGSNDGALVLPLSDCDFPDMRPVLQSCFYLLDKTSAFARGPWDEEMMWLSGADSLSAKIRPTQPASELNAADGGYYTLHSATSWALLRAATFKDRPSHADQLHLDLWWRGQNVLLDPGTYSYHAPVPWEHGFASTRYHNTITVDGADQMTRVSRFLWADWANAFASRQPYTHPGINYLEAEHHGFRRLGVTHRRAILVPADDVWIVVDDIIGSGAHKAKLHWLLPDVKFEVTSSAILDLKLALGQVRLITISSAPIACDLIRGGQRVAGDMTVAPDPALGWFSRFYGRKEAALSFSVECLSQIPIRFVTLIALGRSATLSFNSDCTRIQLDSHRFSLSDIGQTPVIAKPNQRC